VQQHANVLNAVSRSPMPSIALARRRPRRTRLRRSRTCGTPASATSITICTSALR